MRSTFKDSLQGQIWELKKSLRDEESLQKFIFFHGIHLYLQYQHCSYLNQLNQRTQHRTILCYLIQILWNLGPQGLRRNSYLLTWLGWSWRQPTSAAAPSPKTRSRSPHRRCGTRRPCCRSPQRHCNTCLKVYNLETIFNTEMDGATPETDC